MCGSHPLVIQYSDGKWPSWHVGLPIRNCGPMVSINGYSHSDNQSNNIHVWFDTSPLTVVNVNPGIKTTVDENFPGGGLKKE